MHARQTVILFATILGALGVVEPSYACGGFWCSQSAPVNQTAEQIVFVDNGDGTTTCVVQIQYSGPSERFAWVLPVQGVPGVSISSNIAFERLARVTEPEYVLERHVEGECDEDPYGTWADAGAAVAADAGASDPRSVDVLDTGTVGPYDYAVIRPNRELAAAAQVAVEWLETEGYDVAGISSEVLAPYLADGMNLIAFRLTKGTSSGAIRPVVLDYAGDYPSIPIRPTAVAAQNDMGILVYVLSSAQAVPQNYRSLVLNESLIDWFDPKSNYNAVVTAAANEAGGQGFVTEMAGPATVLKGTVFTDADARALAALRQRTFENPVDLLWEANWRYRTWDGWREAIEAAVTLPSGVSFDEFGRNPSAYENDPEFSVDAAVFLERLESDVVEPVAETQKLIDSRPYVTRLFTTMSAEEMTVDPVFVFNSDLGPISNVHTADLYVQCRPGIYEQDAPWRLELPQGGTVLGEGGRDWPLLLDGTIPANRKIVQLSETGAGTVISDNGRGVSTGISRGGGIVTPPPKREPAERGMQIGGPLEPLPAPAPAGSSDAGVRAMPGESPNDDGNGGCGVVRSVRSKGFWALGVVIAAGFGVVCRRRRAPNARISSTRPACRITRESQLGCSRACLSSSHQG